MKKRTFLITGATKGIGRALSGLLADQGHQVIGLARNTDAPGFPGVLASVDLGDPQALAGTLNDLEDYELLASEFSPKEMADLTLAIVTINAWNRFAIGFRKMPAA